jgi:hypothetical protein
MMTTGKPLLAITIPTYNRAERLAATLRRIIPQLTSDVQLRVYDNASTDETAAIVRALGSDVKYFCNEDNVGADRNLLRCLSESPGQYTWLLCDDDRPSASCVSEILNQINDASSEAVVYLRTTGRPLMSKQNSIDACGLDWIKHTKESFLVDIGHWITFCSSLVVKTDRLSIDWLRSQVGSQLVPAAIALQLIGQETVIPTSRHCLLDPMVGEQSAYDAVRIFSANFGKLLTESTRRGWITRQQQQTLYADCLKGAICAYLGSDWRLSIQSACMLLRSSFLYREFYSYCVPALLRRVRRDSATRFRSSARAAARRLRAIRGVS